jgi:hypothetical protein
MAVGVGEQVSHGPHPPRRCECTLGAPRNISTHSANCRARIDVVLPDVLSMITLGVMNDVGEQVGICVPRGRATNQQVIAVLNAPGPESLDASCSAVAEDFRPSLSAELDWQLRPDANDNTRQIVGLIDDFATIWWLRIKVTTT